MKSCEEMVRSLLVRRDRYEAERKRRKKAAVRAAASASCLCLAVMLGLGAWRSGVFRAEIPTVQEDGGQESEDSPVIPESAESDGAPLAPKSESEPETPGEEAAAPEPTEPAEEESQGAPKSESEPEAPVPAVGVSYRWWKGKLCASGALVRTMEADPGGSFAVKASYRPVTAYLTSFFYEGKSLAEWAIAAYDESGQPGSPEAWEGYCRAFDAYTDAVLPPELEKLTELGIPCGRSDEAGNVLLLIVTEEELENLPLADLENWRFDLADAVPIPEETEPEPSEKTAASD